MIFAKPVLAPPVKCAAVKGIKLLRTGVAFRRTEIVCRPNNAQRFRQPAVPSLWRPPDRFDEIPHIGCIRDVHAGNGHTLQLAAEK